MQKRVTHWAVLLLVAALIVTGCTSRVGAGAVVERDPDQFFVDLPALVIDYASDGTASVGGLSHMDIGNTEAPGGVVLEPGIRLGLATVLYAMSLNSFWVQYFTAANIQHFQLNNGPDGIFLMVNGRLIPSLVWEEGSLVATADAVNSIGLGVPALNKLLPLVRNFGVGIVLRFPVTEGTELIPLTGHPESEEAIRARVAQEQMLGLLGGLPTIDLPIIYHADGSWTLAELSDTEWSVLTLVPFWALRLPPSVISSLTSAGITTVTLQTDKEGIHIGVNDINLPYLSWGSGEVQNVLTLVKESGLLEPVEEAFPGSDVYQLMGLVESMLPLVQMTDVNITVYLPGSGKGN